MRKMAAVTLALAVCLLFVGGVLAESETGKAAVQTECPIMDGMKINKSVYVDYEGKRVYFCCAGCPNMFKKDPAKHMKKLKDQGVALEDAPAGAASPAHESDHGDHS
jgi:YHS domain-containing protein